MIDNFIIKRESSALLVIDIQERLFVAMDQKVREKVERNTGILIEMAKICGLPIVVSEQYRKGLGLTIPPLQEKLSGITALEKLHFDCTRDEGLAKEIDGTGRKTIIIAGIESHVCILQTALSLLKKGRNIVIASDAVASRRKHDWETAMHALSAAGAVVYPAETISFLLLEKAGTPEFKKAAPLFK